MTNDPKDDGVAIQLAVLSTKLDGIQTSLNDKFADMRAEVRHLKNNTEQKFVAIEAALDKRPTAKDLADLSADVATKVSTEAFNPIRTVVIWLVGAAGTGILGGFGWLFMNAVK